ncbi:MAG: acyl carrier protein [Clostridia bacterium]|nr:acyl carrier protein [Clostridia bacterium]
MVFEKVKNILAAQFDVDEDSINMETDILEDLGADSLDVMDLMMTLGDEFDMQVDETEIENITTVGALVNFIEANS